MNVKTAIAAAVTLVIGLVIGLLVGGQGGGGGGESTRVSGGGAAERVTLKMASAFPATLPVVGEGGVYVSDLMNELSGGSLNVKFYEANKLVPPLEIFDAVSKGAVDMGYAAAGFWLGKLPAASIFSSIPYGPDSAEYLAWMFSGGGLELYRELYGAHNMWVSPCGIIAPEASGWFREEITSIEQFEGMKIRFYGIGGKVMQKLGASVQLFAPGDIYPALERGVIDATELSFPSIDERLGFWKIAKHYYFPGWHQQATFAELMVNMEVWKGLSPIHQLVIATACRDLTLRSLTLSEATQGEALDKMKSNGVHIHYWSDEILQKFRETSIAVLAEESAKNPDFAKIYNSLQDFRGRYREWARLSRLPADL